MKIKILHVIGGMGRGGAPSFVINNLLKMDSNKIQFDFLVRNNNCVFTDLIEKKGGRVYEVPSFPKHLISNYRKTFIFFSRIGRNYDVVHVHANALYYILPLLLAKKYRIKKIILHSHNTRSNVSIIHPLHYLNKLFVSKFANIFLACGEEAGHWMFGNKPFEVINNAIDTRKFAYNDEFRKEIRHEFAITDDTFVIGNVGRFEEAKNHDFLIDIFYNYVTKHPKTLLMLLGEGTLQNTIKKKVVELGIEDKVSFVGVRSDVHKFYSAMDMMLMPSLFEGLPFVVIEAQCAGLKTLLSTNITDEAIITSICMSKSLEDSIYKWCDAIEQLASVKVQREFYSKLIEEKKYDINYTANRLQEIYTE